MAGTLVYCALVAVLRVSHKRTLSTMNAFDLIVTVVTVARGSTLATVLLSNDVPLAECVLAFALPASLEFVIAFLSTRSGRISRSVKSEPKLLLRNGHFLRRAMNAERVQEEEVRVARRRRAHAAPIACDDFPPKTAVGRTLAAVLGVLGVACRNQYFERQKVLGGLTTFYIV